jgi:hypothetical protein
MPIDIRSEEIFSLTAATKLSCFANRRAGKRINVSTLWRWGTVGVRGVRLETIMAGGTRATSLEAIERFFEQLTLQAEGEHVAPPQSSRMTAARRKQIEAAEKRLANAGV